MPEACSISRNLKVLNNHTYSLCNHHEFLPFSPFFWHLTISALFSIFWHMTILVFFPIFWHMTVEKLGLPLAWPLHIDLHAQVFVLIVFCGVRQWGSALFLVDL